MTENSNIRIARTWFEAFNEHDLEKLLSLYRDDAVHYSPKLKVRQPETKGLISGKPALRAWWKDSFDRLPSLSYHPTHFIADDKGVFMEYLRRVDGEEELRVGEVLEIKEGFIVSSRVYHG
jgi:ketosteroid isomerase-like protein